MIFTLEAGAVLDPGLRSLRKSDRSWKTLKPWRTRLRQCLRRSRTRPCSTWYSRGRRRRCSQLTLTWRRGSAMYSPRPRKYPPLKWKRRGSKRRRLISFNRLRRPRRNLTTSESVRRTCSYVSRIWRTTPNPWADPASRKAPLSVLRTNPLRPPLVVNLQPKLANLVRASTSKS